MRGFGSKEISSKNGRKEFGQGVELSLFLSNPDSAPSLFGLYRNKVQ